MSREIDRKYGSGVTTFKSAESVSDARGQKRNKKAAKFKYKMSGSPERSRNTQYEGRPTGVPGERQIGRNTFKVSASLVKPDIMAARKAKASTKMPKARDMAVGDKNISYVGDPFVVDGKKFDPAKKFPETYMRPEGAKTFSGGGMARGGGAAIKGTKFKGVF